MAGEKKRKEERTKKQSNKDRGEGTSLDMSESLLTLLVKACASGDAQTVQDLLEEGAPVKSHTIIFILLSSIIIAIILIPR